jgi:hypothetical protein
MSDITIIYTAGDAVGFLKGNTDRGQQWLWKNNGGGRPTLVNGLRMATTRELLALIAKLGDVTATWERPLPPSR